MPSHIQGNGDHSGGGGVLRGSGIWENLGEEGNFLPAQPREMGYIYTREEPDWSGKMGVASGKPDVKEVLLIV